MSKNIKLVCFLCKKDYFVYPSVIKKQQKAGTKRTFCCKEHKYEWNKTVTGYWKGKQISYYPRPNRDVAGSKNGRWKGGKRIDKDGYILIWNKNHPFSDYHGYTREHRLVVEKSIGRHLRPDEVVHHKDGNKQNNKIENLELYENGSEHQKEHYHNLKTSRLKHAPKS